MSRPPVYDGQQIDVTPMLDVVFIMLIFFVVTTSFSREMAVSVSRPSSSPTADKEGAVVVSVRATGEVSIGGRRIEAGAVAANLENAIAGGHFEKLVIVAERGAPSGVVIAVVDGARGAGLSEVAVTLAKRVAKSVP